jgi:hypothetical protein
VICKWRQPRDLKCHVPRGAWRWDLPRGRRSRCQGYIHRGQWAPILATNGSLHNSIADFSLVFTSNGPTMPARPLRQGRSSTGRRAAGLLCPCGILAWRAVGLLVCLAHSYGCHHGAASSGPAFSRGFLAQHRRSPRHIELDTSVQHLVDGGNLTKLVQAVTSLGSSRR